MDAFYSLGAKINKRSGDVSDETAEGVVGERLPELELDMEDDEIIKLANKWERAWNDSDVKTKFESDGDENERYWKGDHYTRPEMDKTRAVKDNAIFEGLETYLPQVTRRNPEPMVSLANSETKTDPNQAYAHALQLELGEIADEINLRLKLKGAARNWSIRMVGALKAGWDLDKDMPSVKNIRPSKLILDPEATVDEDGYTGDRVGEHRKLPAWKIKRIMEKGKDSAEKKKFIDDLSKGEDGTEIGFVEWWTADYMFWKCGGQVLVKRKNPHWNYDQPMAPATATTADNGQGVQAEQEPVAAPKLPSLPQGAPAVPQLPEAPITQGGQAPQPTAGVNHLKVRAMPYFLLSVYNLGKQPVDITSNISQNLSNQDLINKRIRQIDKNADTANNGMVVSLERSGLTQQQARGVTKALRAGGVVAIPAGSPQEAVYKPPMNELPVYVYNQLVDTRNRVRDIWGTRGSSPAGTQSEKTVRGKIITQNQDTDRIGGGISEYLEQLADSVYNYLVQMLYVYDDRFVEQISKGVPIPKVKVSVKEGSLLPKDSTTIANQAIELRASGSMSIVDMYKRLDYPNPETLAANVWLEVNAPELLYGNDPRVKQVIQQRQAAAAAGASAEKKSPSVSINFKDLPPDGKAQAAAEAGIKLHPEGIAAHEGVKEAKSNALPNLPDKSPAGQ